VYINVRPSFMNSSFIIEFCLKWRRLSYRPRAAQGRTLNPSTPPPPSTTFQIAMQGYSVRPGSESRADFFSPSRQMEIEYTKKSLSLSPMIKRPGPEADHSPPSSVEVKNARCYIRPFLRTSSCRRA
jgi:hypothetical protein